MINEYLEKDDFNTNKIGRKYSSLYNMLSKDKKFNRVNIKKDFNDYTEPISCKININTFSLDTDINETYSKDHDYPLISLGFHHWIHASKNKTEIFNKFKGKNRIYQIVNSYERYIPDYEESIGNISNIFFDLKNKPKILSRAFYKIWELFLYHDLIDVQNKSFRSIHLAEGPGSFIQAVIFFREKYSKFYNNDKYYGITLHSESNNIPEIEKNFLKYYEKENPKRLYIHTTYNNNISETDKYKDNGDLTLIKTIKNFKKSIDKKADLITADGGLNWVNENLQEQECTMLIFAEIINAVQNQKKGGNFVLKIFEIYTKISLKMIMLLSNLYHDIFITKPLTSRGSNSEKYIICKNFKYEEKDITKLISNLMNSLNNFSKDKKNLIDIYPSMLIPNELLLDIITINNNVSNKQFQIINKMIEFIKGSNYHGELYMRYRDTQIKLSKFWIISFFCKNENIQNILNDVIKIINVSFEKHKNKLKNFKVLKLT